MPGIINLDPFTQPISIRLSSFWFAVAVGATARVDDTAPRVTVDGSIDGPVVKFTQFSDGPIPQNGFGPVTGAGGKMTPAEIKAGRIHRVMTASAGATSQPEWSSFFGGKATNTVSHLYAVRVPRKGLLSVTISHFDPSAAGFWAIAALTENLPGRNLTLDGRVPVHNTAPPHQVPFTLGWNENRAKSTYWNPQLIFINVDSFTPFTVDLSTRVFTDA